MHHHLPHTVRRLNVLAALDALQKRPDVGDRHVAYLRTYAEKTLSRDVLRRIGEGCRARLGGGRRE